jgi:hypothetical protein
MIKFIKVLSLFAVLVTGGQVGIHEERNGPRKPRAVVSR